jgi:hypothetical protein
MGGENDMESHRRIVMKRFALVAILFAAFFAASASNASARYFYRRPVARAVLPPYPVARRAYYGPRYYGPRYYGPRFYGYGPAFYGPGAFVGVGIY